MYSLTFHCSSLVPNKHSFKGRRIEIILDPRGTGHFTLQAISVGIVIQGQVSIHNGKPTFCILGNSSIENKRVISEFT